MHQIVVLGSGFAALTAIRTLRKEGWKEKIILISPRSHLTYYPSLIWVPAGLRNEKDLTVSLEKFFQKYDVFHHKANVTGLSAKKQHVYTDAGTIAFDKLIVGTGGRFIKKLPGIEHAFIPCESFEATNSYSQRLAVLNNGTLAFGFSSNPKEPAAMRGGPIFEFLFGIDTLLRKQGRRQDFELVFFSPAAEPGKRLGDSAVTALLHEMDKRSIQTHLGHKLSEFKVDGVITEGGEFHSDLTLFMPGMTGPAWLANSDLPLSEGGFIQADEHCRIPGIENIFVAGDSGSYPGPGWLPKQAHIADLQAIAAVKNLLADIQGLPADYKFKPELICIVDAYSNGMLIYRDPERNVLLPKSILFHWSKRFFEWWYLRGYR